MSEPIGMTFEVGGLIKALTIQELLTALDNEVSEYTGPSTVQEFRAEVKKHGKKGGTIKWYGTSDYGECEDLKKFCVENNIPYIHTCDGKYEYSAGTAYWLPGMEEEILVVCTQNGDPVVSIKEARALIDKLLGLIEIYMMGVPAPPVASDIKTLEDTRKEINDLLPVVPDLPKVVIEV